MTSGAVCFAPDIGHFTIPGEATALAAYGPYVLDVWRVKRQTIAIEGLGTVVGIGTTGAAICLARD
jgi:hypothetical protein